MLSLFSFQNVAAVAVETSITFPQVEKVKVDYNCDFITMYNLIFVLLLGKNSLVLRWLKAVFCFFESFRTRSDYFA